MESEKEREPEIAVGAAGPAAIRPPVAGGLASRFISEIKPEEPLNSRPADEDEAEEPQRSPFFAPALRSPDTLRAIGGDPPDDKDPWATPSTSRGPRRSTDDDDDGGRTTVDARWLESDEDDRQGGTRALPLAARPPESMLAPKTTPQHKNRRLLAAGILAAVLILAFMVSSKKNSAETQKDDKQTAIKSQGQPAMQFTSPGDSELGTPNRSGNPFPAQQPPVVVQAPPAPVEPPKPTAPPPVERQPEEAHFAVVMRAGDQSTKESAEEARLKGAQKRVAGQGGTRPGGQNDDRFQRGTRITLQLAEPLRSGIASVVTAQVLSDVVGKDGEVIIPAGSKAAIPFYPGENQGRMLNNVAEPAMFITPTGEEIPLFGTVKGSDGFTGITGKVIKVGGPSAVRRVIGGVGRIGERVAGRALGGSGAAGDVGQEGIYEVDRATGGISGQLFDRSTSIVQVPTGAALTFELSWKAHNGH